MSGSTEPEVIQPSQVPAGVPLVGPFLFHPPGYLSVGHRLQAFAYSTPEQFADYEVAPLLCAGIIGYRALRRSKL